MDTKVARGFWTDSRVEALDKDATLALLWLMTALINEAGWVPLVSIRRFEFESKTSWDALQRACEGLGEGIVIHERGWWLRHYIRHQIGTGASLGKNLMARAVVKRFRDMPGEIIAACLEQYPELHEITKPFASPSEVHGKDRRGEERRGEEDQGRGAGEGTPLLPLPERAGLNPPGPPTWDEVKLFTAIRDAYNPVRRDAPQRVLDIIQDTVHRGASPEEMLAGTKECARLYLRKFPAGTIGRFAPKAENFFAKELWNDPPAFGLLFEGPVGAAEKKEGRGFSGEKKKGGAGAEIRLAGASSKREPGCEWRTVLKELYPEEQYPDANYGLPWLQYQPEMRSAVLRRCWELGLLLPEPEPGWRLVLEQLAQEDGLRLEVGVVPWRELGGALQQRVLDRLAAVPKTGRLV